MIRQCLGIILLTTVLHAGAQVTMTLPLPPAGVLLKKQLWNVSLVYTGDNPIYTRLQVTVSDAVTGQPVITAASGNITLSKGARLLQADDLSPIQYQYPSATVADRDPDGFLPVGRYQACYTLLLNDERDNTPLAEDCLGFEVEPLSPPLLNTPANEDTLQTTLPQFTWMPPAPTALFANLSYRVNIVEVLPGQNPADAMEQNIPVYFDDHCPDPFLNYPASGLALDTGKTYAWQIIALNNFQPAAQSEVWTFRIGNKMLKQPGLTNTYFTLSSNQVAQHTYIISAKVASVKFYSYMPGYEAEVAFQDQAGKILQKSRQKIQYGYNYISWTLGKVFQKNTVYIITLTDPGNNKYSARFIIK